MSQNTIQIISRITRDLKDNPKSGHGTTSVVYNIVWFIQEQIHTRHCMFVCNLSHL